MSNFLCGILIVLFSCISLLAQPVAYHGTFTNDNGAGIDANGVVSGNGAGLTNLKAIVDIWDFNPAGDGVTDDTPKFVAAIASLTNYGGGVINYYPRGSNFKGFALHLVVTNENIVLRGQLPSSDHGGSNLLVAFSATQPVITVGNDMSYAQGFAMYDTTINGYSIAANAQAPSCLVLNGGAYGPKFFNCGFTGGTNVIVLQGQTNYPATLGRWLGCQITPSSSTGTNTSAISMLAASGGAYTTSMDFIGCHVNGASTGWAINCSNAEMMLSAGTYVDGATGHMLFSQGGGFWLMDGSVTLDSAGGNSLVTDNITNTFVDYYLRGRNLSINYSIMPASGVLTNNTGIYVQATQGSLQVPNGSGLWTVDTAGTPLQILFSQALGWNTYLNGSTNPTGNLNLTGGGIQFNTGNNGGATNRMSIANSGAVTIVNNATVGNNLIVNGTTGITVANGGLTNITGGWGIDKNGVVSGNGSGLTNVSANSLLRLLTNTLVLGGGWTNTGNRAFVSCSIACNATATLSVEVDMYVTNALGSVKSNLFVVPAGVTGTDTRTLCDMVDSNGAVQLYTNHQGGATVGLAIKCSTINGL